MARTKKKKATYAVPSTPSTPNVSCASGSTTSPAVKDPSTVPEEELTDYIVYNYVPRGFTHAWRPAPARGLAQYVQQGGR